MNFDWEAFGREKIAVHCKTEAEAIDFCKRAEEKGFDWEDGSKRSSKTEWDDYKHRTCYSKHRFGNFECYEAQDYKILELSDYMGFPELKDGYVVEVEDDEGKSLLMIYTTASGALCASGEKNWFPINSLDANGIYIDGACKVLTVYGRSCSNFRAHIIETEHRKLLWHREEPTEMTLSEICAALGKTVKIVKEH